MSHPTAERPELRAERDELELQSAERALQTLFDETAATDADEDAARVERLTAFAATLTPRAGPAHAAEDPSVMAQKEPPPAPVIPLTSRREVWPVRSLLALAAGLLLMMTAISQLQPGDGPDDGATGRVAMQAIAPKEEAMPAATAIALAAEEDPLAMLGDEVWAVELDGEFDLSDASWADDDADADADADEWSDELGW